TMFAFEALTYSIGLIGLSANGILIYAIRRNTPEALCKYAIIFLAAACCDCIGLLSMLITGTREVIFSGSCMLEFHGVCSLFSDAVTCVPSGLQEYMYDTTVSILCLSFVYRLQIIRDTKFANRKV
ncbi:hypothetical protein PMAYCL1PPCAC_25072, partial [Pristionchus mayeri]